MYIALDQAGNAYPGIKAPTRKSIREKFSLLPHARITAVYTDKEDGSTKQVGFYISSLDLWLTLYRMDPWEIDA